MNKQNLYVSVTDKISKLISNIMFGAGIVLDILTLLLICASIDMKDFSIFMIGMILFFLPGTGLIFFGNKRKRKAKLMNEYLKYINTRRNINMDTLCQEIGVNKEKAIQDITEMINKKMINGYIDETNSLILSEYEKMAEEKEKQENEKTMIIKCSQCGAQNTVSIGVPQECMYCGTMLQDKNHAKV